MNRVPYAIRLPTLFSLMFFTEAATLPMNGSIILIMFFRNATKSEFLPVKARIMMPLMTLFILLNTTDSEKRPNSIPLPFLWIKMFLKDGAKKWNTGKIPVSLLLEALPFI